MTNTRRASTAGCWSSYTRRARLAVALPIEGFRKPLAEHESLLLQGEPPKSRRKPPTSRQQPPHSVDSLLRAIDSLLVPLRALKSLLLPLQSSEPSSTAALRIELLLVLSTTWLFGKATHSLVNLIIIQKNTRTLATKQSILLRTRISFGAIARGLVPMAYHAQMQQSTGHSAAEGPAAEGIHCHTGDSYQPTRGCRALT
jgi:hypothetical protein